MALLHRIVEAKLVRVSWGRRITLQKATWREGESSSRPRSDARNVQLHLKPTLVEHKEWRTDTQFVNGEKQEVRHEVTRYKLNTERLYTFEAPAWAHSRYVDAKGVGQSDVYWPDFTLADGERESERTEVYHATFSAVAGMSGSAREYTLPLTQGSWRSLRVGGTYPLRLGRLDGTATMATGD